jgi:hypothetical protein
MISRSLSDEFLSFFQRYLAFYEEFLQLETEKYNEIIANKLDQLDQRVKNEEAYMLKSRGLEAERDKLMAKTENPSATFRELIPLLDESAQAEAQALYDKLSQVLKNLKHTNLRCNYLTKLKLHRIEVNLEKIKNHPELQKLYNAQAVENAASSRILSKKV